MNPTGLLHLYAKIIPEVFSFISEISINLSDISGSLMSLINYFL